MTQIDAMMNRHTNTAMVMMMSRDISSVQRPNIPYYQSTLFIFQLK